MRKSVLSILQTSALPLGYRALAQSTLQRGAITVCLKCTDKQFRQTIADAVFPNYGWRDGFN
jgi:hypothetical protein